MIKSPLVEDYKQLESPCLRVLLQDSKPEQSLLSQYFILVILYFNFYIS